MGQSHLRQLRSADGELILLLRSLLHKGQIMKELGRKRWKFRDFSRVRVVCFQLEEEKILNTFLKHLCLPGSLLIFFSFLSQLILVFGVLLLLF